MTAKKDFLQQAKLFTALSDSTRLQIVEQLAHCEEMATATLAEKLAISLSLACHHTKTLAEVGLVEKRKERQTTYNRLNRSLLQGTLEILTRWMKSFPSS